MTAFLVHFFNDLGKYLICGVEQKQGEIAGIGSGITYPHDTSLYWLNSWFYRTPKQLNHDNLRALKNFLGFSDKLPNYCFYCFSLKSMRFMSKHSY